MAARLSPRLLLPTVALAMTAVGLADPVEARPLQRIQNTVDDFSCAFQTEEGAAVYFFGQASTNGSGSAAFVEGGGLSLEGWEGTASFTGGALDASVELRTIEGEAFGTLSVHAQAALGAPTVEEVEDRSGNTWTRGTVTVADYTFSGVELAVSGLTPIVDDATCSGQRTIFDVRSTDPASRVYRDRSLDSSPCTIQGMADAELLLSGQRREPYVEIVIGAQGLDPRKAQGSLEASGSSWVASLPLIALATGEQVDVLHVTATMSRAGAPTRERVAEGGFAEMGWVVPYTVTFEIQTGEGRQLTAECAADELRSHVTISPQLVGA